jgi:hypothetical protein
MAVLSKAFGDEYDHQTVDAQTQEVIKALRTAYPQLQGILNPGKITAAEGDLAASQAVSPGFNNLALGELERTAPVIARVQGSLDSAQAANDLANLQRYGADMGTAMRGTDAAANPEFYKNLDTLGAKYAEALGGLSPTMSAGQRAEMERGVARMAPNTTDASAINVAEKAANFGAAGQQQQMNFVNAIHSISAALPSLKTGLNPNALALGRDSRSSPVAGAVTPVTKPTGEATQLGTGMYSGLANTQAGINQMKAGAFKTWGDAVLQDSESFKNIASGAASIAGASDINIKQNITPAPSVLERVEQLPLFEWEYKPETNLPAGRHIGPMAQDFKAAFDLGTDDKTINLLDGQGVLFQAIKELAARVRQLEAQL